MSDRSFILYIGLLLLIVSTVFIWRGRADGRCEATCWSAGYAYTSAEASACLCDGGGVPVALAVPRGPK